ncbi:hypothetical protein GCM10010198_15140 [Nocardia seriolae]|nr:hypothetical protein NS2_00990 [Nocardia seriolae NBRC 15557]
MIPRVQHGLALTGVEHVDIAHHDVRRGYGGLQDAQVAPPEFADGGGVEQVGGVGQHHRQPSGLTGQAALLGQRPLQVELGDVDLELVRRDGEAGQLHGAVRHLLERQHDLEQRMPGLRTGRVDDLDQPFEGDVGVGEGRQIGVPGARQEVGEALRPIHFRAQHQGVDEHADQVVEGLFTASGDRGADGDVGGTREPGQQHGQGAVHDHEQRDTLGASQTRQLRVQLGRDLEGDAGAVEALHRRARAVGREVELIRQTGQSATPVGDLARGHGFGIGFRTEQLALPDAEVLVLHRQRGPRGLLTGDARQVGGGHVARERTEREAVRRNVMHDERDREIDIVGLGRGVTAQFRRDPEDPHANRQLGRDVEPGGGEFRQRGGQFGLGEVGHLDAQLHLVDRQHPLEAAVAGLGEDGAQRFLARHHVGQRQLQGLDIDLPAQPHHEGQVVGRDGGVELVEEPHALLCQRQRHPLRALLRHQRRPRDVRGPSGFHARGQTRHGRGLEQRAHTQPGAERRRDTRHHLGGDQRVAAQIEEVVIHADPLVPEHIGEHARHDLLGGGARRPITGGVRAEHRLGQGLAVQLAGGVEREGIQHRDRRRDHVRRQLLRGEAGQLGRVDALSRHRHHVGDQLLTGRGVHHQDGGLADGRMGQQVGLDLAELDALTAELHLEVGAADVLQRARLVPANEVTGAVHAFAVGRQRIRHEAIRGQIRATLVPARQLTARQIQLTRGTDGGRAQPRIQNVDLDIPLGHTDRYRDGVGGGVLPVGHRDRGLGRSVQVVQPRVGDLAEARAGLRRQRLTDHENVAQRGALDPGGVRDEHRQHRRHEVGDRDAVALDHIGHVQRVAVTVGGGHQQLRADQQRHEVAPQRHVEGLRGLLQVHIVRGHRILVEHPEFLVDDGVVGDRDALGAAGGTRGVDDVGGVVRAQRGQPIRVRHRLCGEAGDVEGVDLQAPHPSRGACGAAIGRSRQFQVVARAGQHADRCRGLEDVGGAIGRVIRVDRHVRATGAQHRVHADDQLQRAPHAQGDKRFRADAVGDQEAGQAVDARAELGIRQLLALELDGDIVRGERNLLVQQGRKRGGRHLVRRLVPLDQGLGAFGLAGDRQAPHGLALPRRQEAVEELQEPRVVAARLVLGVQVRVGLEVDVVPGALHRLVEVDAQVLDGTGGQHAVLTGDVAQHDLVVEQHDVDPRAEELRTDITAGELARGVAAYVLGAVALVPQRTRHRDRHLREQLGHGGAVPDVQAQRHDVRGRAARAAHDRGGARGHREAEDDVLAAGPLREVGGETRDQQPGGRGFVAGHGGVQQRGLIPGERAGGNAVHGRGRRGTPDQAGAVLESGDPLGPVLLVGLETAGVAVGEFLLDQGGQVGQLVRRGLDAAHVRGVELGDAGHVGHRAETVQHDVVDAGVPVVMALGQFHHGRLDETVAGEVQRGAVVGAHPGLGGRGRIGLAAQVDVIDGAIQRLVHHLHRLAVTLDDAQEARSELLRAADHGAFEQLDVEFAAQLHVLGDIDRYLRVQMLGVPDTELRGRQWEKRTRSRSDFAASFAVAAEIQPVQHKPRFRNTTPRSVPRRKPEQDATAASAWRPGFGAHFTV